LDSKDPNKRAQLIEELLSSPRYGRHMADIWQRYLLPRTSDNRQLKVEPLSHWLEESFNANKPWDQFVSELITASGTQDENAAVSENGRARPAKLPGSAKVVPAKFLQGEQPKLDTAAPYRPVLAKWLTSPENPYLARAMVNRLWAHFFGRGIVDPVDDMHDGN